MSRKAYRWSMLSLFWLALSSVSAAQTTRNLPPMGAEVNGQVRQAAGSTPVERALVRVEPVSGGLAGQTLTDSTGKFQLAGLSPGIYNVTVKSLGFTDYQQQLDLSTMPRQYLQVHVTCQASQCRYPSRGAKRI
jgi:hypothetical protein